MEKEELESELEKVVKEIDAKIGKVPCCDVIDKYVKLQWEYLALTGNVFAVPIPIDKGEYQI